MAYQHNADLRSAPAAADQTGKRGYACVVNSSRQAALYTTAGGRGFGVVVEEATRIGDICTYAVGGVVPVSAGGAFSAGADLMINAEGQFVVATATNHIVAVAVETSPGDNAIVSAEIIYRGVA